MTTVSQVMGSHTIYGSLAQMGVPDGGWHDACLEPKYMQITCQLLYILGVDALSMGCCMCQSFLPGYGVRLLDTSMWCSRTVKPHDCSWCMVIVYNGLLCAVLLICTPLHLATTDVWADALCSPL
jgi:hypothetical protein